MAKSKYKDDFPERAKKYAEKGLTEAQIAKNLGVSVSTFETYKIKFPEFLEALKEGKQTPDDEVESALFSRAIGFKYIETTEDPTGVRTVEKQALPDTTAQIFWLKNRRPERWRDKRDIEHSGGIGIMNAELQEKLDNLSTEDLEKIANSGS